MRLKPSVTTVLALSLALTGCGALGGKSGGDEPKSPQTGASSSPKPTGEAHVAPAAVVLPRATDMPEPLRMTRDSDFYGDLQGQQGGMDCPQSEKRCEGVVTGGMTEYGREMLKKDGEYANFEVWEYRTSVSARSGYDAWKEQLGAGAKGFLAVESGRYGEDVAAMSEAAAGRMGVRTMVARQGKYVGVVRTYTKADSAPGEKQPVALFGLTKMLVERMRQADQDYAPNASAEHLDLTGS